MPLHGCEASFPRAQSLHIYACTQTHVPQSQALMSSQGEIAASLTRIYKLFLHLGYIESDSVHWPPHPPHVLNFARLREIGLPVSSANLRKSHLRPPIYTSIEALLLTGQTTMTLLRFATYSLRLPCSTPPFQSILSVCRSHGSRVLLLQIP